MIMVTMFASTVAAAIVSIAQYNVFFAVVEEIANHFFQQNIVTVFIDTFDEIAGFFFLGGIPAQNLILAVQRNRLLSVFHLVSYFLPLGSSLSHTRSAQQGLFHK